MSVTEIEGPARDSAESKALIVLEEVLQLQKELLERFDELEIMLEEFGVVAPANFIPRR